MSFGRHPGPPIEKCSKCGYMTKRCACGTPGEAYQKGYRMGERNGKLDERRRHEMQHKSYDAEVREFDGTMKRSAGRSRLGRSS